MSTTTSGEPTTTAITSIELQQFLANLEERITTNITKKITSSETTVKHHLDAKFCELDKRLTKIEEDSKTQANKIALNTNLTGDAMQVASQNKNDIIDLRAEMDKLTVSNTSLVGEVNALNMVVATQVIRNQVREVCAEDLANRSLRKTICIRGIPDDGEEETWDITREVAAKALHEVTNIPETNIANMFERIHRGPKSTKPNVPRKIYAAVYDWNSIDFLTKELRKHGKQSQIYIDRQFGPDTSYRQNLALTKRKALKQAGTISSGYVKFPAQLFVKYGNALRYVLCEDFSKIPIPDEEYERRQKYNKEGRTAS